MIWIYTNACMYYIFIIYITYMYVCMLNCSVMSDSLQIHGLQPARLLCPWDFISKNIEVGCHFLLQHIINIMYYEYLWIYTNTIYTIILFTDGSQIPETLTLSYQPAGVGTSTLLPSDRLTGCENWWQARENPCFWSWAHGVGVPRPGQTAEEHVFLGGRSWIWA